MSRSRSSLLDRPISDIEVGVAPLGDWTDVQPPVVDAPQGFDRSWIRRVPSEGTLVFSIALGIFLTVAVLVDLKYHTYPLDSFSRMANGFYILYSRDPHLAAVGFVWDPLSSLADMVFLLGNHFWPALARDNMAGSLTSSIAMAGAVYQVCASLREWGVSRTPRLILTAFFALNPMIAYYGGNGMSEGLFLFTLIASTRYLLRWMCDGDLRSLAYSAVALGFCYLTRNEAAMAALLGGIAVGVVSFFRTNGRTVSRIKTAISDLAIFGVPAFTAALGWAVVSYIITGEFFAQIQSIYGSAAQEKWLVHKTFHGRVIYELHALAAFAPFALILLAAAAFISIRRRDPRILAPLTVLGGALLFDMVSFLGNGIQNYLRYWIVALPLGILLLGSLLAAIQASGSEPTDGLERIRPTRPGIRKLGALAAVVMVSAVMIPTTISTGSSMLNPAIGVEESDQIGFIFKSHPSASNLVYPHAYPQSLALGRQLVNLQLPNGNILVDNSVACVPIIVVTSSQPKLFVIPNDRDFQRILADPISFHTHYILEANPSSAPNTAMNLEYPSLWNTGAGFTKQVRQFPARAACPEFRLFHVIRHSNTVS